MIVRLLLALLLFASVTAVAAPPPAAASDTCDACPAAGGAGDDCADDCPLCVCGPHRAPMTEPPAIPILPLSPAAEFLAHGDHAALAPAPHDILHVPRLLAVPSLF
jgi:hypothetical protein